MITPNTTVLFQGDSITDTGRNREDTSSHSVWALGSGYAMMAAAQLLAESPGDGLKFYNRGISGNRIVDLDARIKRDVIHLNPDLLSVLIGVNDTMHGFNSKDGVSVPKFGRVYREFLSEVRENLPGIRFVLCEPFLLRSGPVTDAWVAELSQRREIVRELAREFSAVFVPFQSAFDAVLHDAPPEYWAQDGVHPTAPGHQLMAQAWLRHVR